ncbi:MAG: endonuclease [Actinophytocola sp.]|nr:endonuclease [Actinophytocola sp.]
MPGRHDRVVRALLDRHGQTYASEAGIRLADTPAPLFQHLVLSLLLSARIKGDIAIAAARALSEAGWTTPAKMAGATWAARTGVLNRSGYARYDERTSRMLGTTAETLLTEYGGDLRRLRAAADGDTGALRTLLTQFSGIGNVGADIFLREAQGVWDEVYPFVDSRAASGAKMLGLPTTARGMSPLVAAGEFPRLVSACVRVTFAKDAAELKAA